MNTDELILCVENTQITKSRRCRSILADMSIWRRPEGVPPQKAKRHVRKVREVTRKSLFSNMRHTVSKYLPDRRLQQMRNEIGFPNR